MVENWRAYGSAKKGETFCHGPKRLKISRRVVRVCFFEPLVSNEMIPINTEKEETWAEDRGSYRSLASQTRLTIDGLNLLPPTLSAFLSFA